MARGPVAVSGITGFVGAQVVKDLLGEGYTVHGTARNISNPERLAHITGLPGAAERFRAFSADLLTPGAFDEALVGCTGAIHCASPYAMHVGDAQKDLIDPAVKGTISFLESAVKAGVPKVVVTSSVAAVADRGQSRTLTEDDWNTTSSVAVMPYYASKAQAERAAWDFAKEHPEMKVVTINPFVVVGPSLVKSVNESNALLRTMAVAGPMDGGFPGIMDLTLTFVDNRDVSRAHILALESPSADGREKPLHHKEIVQVLTEKGFTPRSANLSNGFVTKAMRFLSSFSRDPGLQFMHRQIGNPLLVDNSKIKADLGMTFMDPVQSIKDTLDDMTNWGHLTKQQ